MIGGGGSVAILCPGPSLTRFLEDRPQHDLYVAVNRAASAFPADWWVFQDEQVWGRVKPQGTPLIFTSADMERTFAHRQNGALFEWTTFQQIGSCTTCKSRPPWWSYTATAALVLADHLKAGEVVMYGADMHGRDDWDGTEPSGAWAYRSNTRWEREQWIFGHVAGWLENERGIPVTREFVDAEHADD